MSEFNVLDFGAKGDGQADDCSAIQEAIDTCHKTGGGRVLLPGGYTFLSSSLCFKGKVDFHIQQGAILRCKTDKESFNYFAFPMAVVVQKAQKRVFLYAMKADNLKISGGGLIDGQGHSFMVEEKEKIYVGNMWRPAMFCLIGCKQLDLTEFTLKMLLIGGFIYRVVKMFM